MVKLRTARCLKDKISSGQFLVIVHALDRVGGNRLLIEARKTEEKYRLLSTSLRDFALKKRQFLNQENRSVVQSQADGSKYVGATKTGIGFFQ